MTEQNPTSGITDGVALPVRSVGSTKVAARLEQVVSLGVGCRLAQLAVLYHCRD